MRTDYDSYGNVIGDLIPTEAKLKAIVADIRNEVSDAEKFADVKRYIKNTGPVEHPMGHADKTEPEKFDWRINVTCIEKHPVKYMPTDIEKDKMIADALHNGGKPFTHVYGANVIVTPSTTMADAALGTVDQHFIPLLDCTPKKHKCHCSRQQLMRDGCKCGGM